MTAVAVVGFLACLGGAIAFQVHRARRERERALITHLGDVPEVVRVPRREREPDPERVLACVEEARILVTSVRGAFASPTRDKHDPDGAATLDSDLLDAVTDMRDALALLREAAERDSSLDGVFRARDLDPWTEPDLLDAIHIRPERARPAFAEGARYAERILDALRRWEDRRPRAGSGGTR